jgi:hypothetical protein
MLKLGFALLIFAASCGDSTHHNNNVCGPLQCTGAGASYDLNGRFGVLVQLFVDVQAAGGLIDCSVANSAHCPPLESDLLLLADVTQTGSQATLGVQVCDLVLPPIPVKNARPLTFQIDPSLLASVGTVMSSGTIDGPGTCANLQQTAPLILVLGAKLHDPINDALPTYDTMTGTYTACGGSLMACSSVVAPASGACVCDQEGDAKLGATLGVMNAPVFSDLNKAYVALRTNVMLSGRVFSSDQIAGTVQATLEQVILGCQRSGSDCTNGDLGIVQGVSPTIMQSDNSKDACLTSTFIGKRIPMTTDCAALKAMQSTLFPQ